MSGRGGRLALWPASAIDLDSAAGAQTAGTADQQRALLTSNPMVSKLLRSLMHSVLLPCCTPHVPSADPVHAAPRQAFDEGPWPRMTGEQRARVLLRLADLVEVRRPVGMQQPMSVKCVRQVLRRAYLKSARRLWPRLAWPAVLLEASLCYAALCCVRHVCPHCRVPHRRSRSMLTSWRCWRPWTMARPLRRRVHRAAAHA